MIVPAGWAAIRCEAEPTTQMDARLSWTIPSFRPNGILNFQRGAVAVAVVVAASVRAAPAAAVVVKGISSSAVSRCICSRTNLLNRVNKSAYVGVQTSPFFMHATSAQAARRVELGWRFSF